MSELKTEKEYKEKREYFLYISSETRKNITALAVTIIGAMYIFSSSSNIKYLKISLLFFIITIFIEIISGFLKSQHYTLWFDGKIPDDDFRSSNYGKTADFLFFIQPVIIFISIIIFGLAILK